MPGDKNDHPTMPDIQITSAGVDKLLQGQDPAKAPDNIAPRVQELVVAHYYTRHRTCTTRLETSLGSKYIVVGNVTRHLDASHIFTCHHSGFKCNRSCETRRPEYSEHLSCNLEKGLQTDLVIMDFAQAFNCVNHSLLISTSSTTMGSEATRTGGSRTSCRTGSRLV
ncbi:hypothetical protein BaRGS_00034998 [Batillaria attramentaria]|uniref:Reverse transcriptase domain-containing protein n=1 Tax=Batillaria attramentaria TaxID=370345 RepID=A0ABD0JFY2_9CAEN